MTRFNCFIESRGYPLTAKQVEFTTTVTGRTSSLFQWVNTQAIIKLPSDLFCSLPPLSPSSLSNWGTLLKLCSEAYLPYALKTNRSVNFLMLFDFFYSIKMASKDSRKALSVAETTIRSKNKMIKSVSNMLAGRHKCSTNLTFSQSYALHFTALNVCSSHHEFPPYLSHCFFSIPIIFFGNPNSLFSKWVVILVEHSRLFTE